MKKIASAVVTTYLLSLGGVAFAQSQNANEAAAGATKKAAATVPQGGVIGAVGTQAGGLLPFALAPLAAVLGTAAAGVAAVAGTADTTTQHSGNR